MFRRNNQKGFTLLEMLIALGTALSLLGIVAAVGIPARRAASNLRVENEIRTVLMVAKQGGRTDFGAVSPDWLIRTYPQQLAGLIKVVNQARPQGDIVIGGESVAISGYNMYKPSPTATAVHSSNANSILIQLEDIDADRCQYLVDAFRSTAVAYQINFAGVSCPGDGGGSGGGGCSNGAGSTDYQTQGLYDRTAVTQACVDSSRGTRRLGLVLN